jgi:hypothetical protein
MYARWFALRVPETKHTRPYCEHARTQPETDASTPKSRRDTTAARLAPSRTTVAAQGTRTRPLAASRRRCSSTRTACAGSGCLRMARSAGTCAATCVVTGRLSTGLQAPAMMVGRAFVFRVCGLCTRRASCVHLYGTFDAWCSVCAIYMCVCARACVCMYVCMYIAAISPRSLSQVTHYQATAVTTAWLSAAGPALREAESTGLACPCAETPSPSVTRCVHACLCKRVCEIVIYACVK